MRDFGDFRLGSLECRDIDGGDRKSSFSTDSLSARAQSASVHSGSDWAQLNLLGAIDVGVSQFAVSVNDGDRNGAVTFAQRPVNPEIIVYPERDGHGYKGGNPIAAPSTVASIGAPVIDLGTISFAPNFSVGGTIVDDSSFDVYQISLTAGETWTFSVYGSGGTPLEDTVIYLYDPNGNFITLDDDGGAGRMSLLSHTAGMTGDYFVAVSNFPGLGDLSGDYTLDFVQMPPSDVVPDTFGGAELVGLGTTYGFIDGDGANYLSSSLGEIDTYALNVTAGKIYTIEIAGGADYASDYTALIDELDPVLVVWDSNGNFVGLNDDISFPNDINSGFSFIADADGTYYFDVMSYDPWTGGFSITITEQDPADFDPIESLVWDNAANVTFDATNTAYVYFAPAGENFGELADDGVSPMVTHGWNAWEIQQVMDALEEYEKILGVNYEITTDVNQATFRLLTTTSTQYGAYFYPQDPAFGTAQGIGVFNVASGGWSADQQQSLMQGGFAYAVVLHEFGHAHGLSHPHDTGGGSEVMLGVTAAQGSLGLFDLNQGVYTVMSYNDAWERHPDGPTPFTLANIDSGWSGTLGAFDIAALQQRYGVVNPYATGNNVYLLGDINDPGTYYETIWDTGGTDEIRYDGMADARIDLLAATLDYTPTGGGAISFVDGIWGGYTIANGVVIENATGGDGNDALLGNDAANVLLGRDGDDTLVGRAGADTLNGGAGFDTASYVDAGAGVAVNLRTNTGSAGDAAGDRLISIEALVGSAFNDTLIGSHGDDASIDGFAGDDLINGGNGKDTLLGGDGNDTLIGGNANDNLDGGAGDDSLDGGNGNEILAGGAGNDTLRGGNGHDDLDGGDDDDLVDGGNGNDTMLAGAGDDTMIGANGHDDLYGGDGDDRMIGGNGNDLFNGGAGNDTMTGGNGNDWFLFTDLGGTDMITDFRRGRDKVDLSGLDAIDGGAVDMFAWIGSSTFSGAAGELRSYNAGGVNYLEGDTNGDMVADFIVQTNVLLQASDIYFG